MVSDLQSDQEETTIPHFGTVDGEQFDSTKSYVGQVYPISPESTKAVVDAIGFAANFERPSTRNAYVDLTSGEGRIVLEIDRNTKPQDIGVRYSRDRWSVLDLTAKGKDGAKALIRSEYQARTIEEEVLTAVALALDLPLNVLTESIVRINLKERSYALVVEESRADILPPGATNNFSIAPGNKKTASIQEDLPEPAFSEAPEDPLPEPPEVRPEPPETSIPPIATTSDAELSPKEEPTKMSQERQASSSNTTQRTDTTQGQAKYATYSMSEIDYMMKQQVESITAALGGKISAQQRTFLEAVANQEKVFNKLTDTFMVQLDTSKTRLEAITKNYQEATKGEIEQFQKQLSKELDQNRAAINKTVMPVAKALEDKNIKLPAKEAKATPQQTVVHQNTEKLQKLMMATLVVSVVSMILNVVALLMRAN